MSKGSSKSKKATPKKVATKKQSVKIAKSPKKDSKFTKTIEIYADQKDYFKMD